MSEHERHPAIRAVTKFSLLIVRRYVLDPSDGSPLLTVDEIAVAKREAIAKVHALIAERDTARRVAEGEMARGDRLNVEWQRAEARAAALEADILASMKELMEEDPPFEVAMARLARCVGYTYPAGEVRGGPVSLIALLDARKEDAADVPE